MLHSTKPLEAFGEAYFGALGNGAEVFVWPTKKFKSEVARLTLGSPMDQRCALRTLYSAVLRRGSKNHPTTQQLSRHMEDLYGASVHYDIGRRGNQQLISWSTDSVDPRFIPDQKPSMRDATWGLLKEITREPCMEEGELRGEIIERERENLIRTIEGLVNDKMTFATMRLYQVMYPDDPYGLLEWGTIDGLKAIEKGELSAGGRSFYEQAPMEIYVVGSMEVEEAVRRAQDLGEGWNPSSPGPFVKPVCAPAPSWHREQPASWNEVIEEQDVQQAKMILGCRVEFDELSDLEFSALGMLNILLGEGMHSKLFKVVREQHGLAYHVSSSLDRLSGHLSISAGIDPSHYEQARDLSWKQIRAIAEGDVSDDEMSASQEMYYHRMRGLGDRPASMAGFLGGCRSTGRWLTPEERMELVRRMTPSDLAAAAQRVRPHTAYLLKGSAS